MSAVPAALRRRDTPWLTASRVMVARDMRTVSSLVICMKRASGSRFATCPTIAFLRE